KSRFNNWLNNRQDLFKQKLCPLWNKLQSIPCFHKKLDLIVAIVVDAVVVLNPDIHASHVAVVVTILVTDGYLDRLCVDCSKD
ncbi:MAG: hypothetical protein BWK78_05120, partial [Thiotrichaceae bacterium IS1]